VSDGTRAAPQGAGRRVARTHPQSALGSEGGTRGAWWLRLAVVGWLLGWLAGTAAALGDVVDVPRLPAWAPRYGAGLVAVLLAVALARRSGGRVWFWTLLATAFVGVVLAADRPWLYSSAAVFVAVVGGVASVLLTRPAPTYVRILYEYAIALVLATSAGLAVAALDAPVNSDRYNVLVLALTLAAAMALVWRLGAGFHGLGRRGVLMMVAGAVLVTAVLVYSRILREYGSTTVTTAVEDVITWTRDLLNGVPRPIEVLVGFPALLWGVHTRAHRRQGWWICAFATFGTATIATTLASPLVDPAYAGRSLLYSIGLGLLIGLVVVRVDTIVTARRAAAAAGRRARRDEPEPEPLRPEPGRAHPLR
jgi:hypothetical protein